MKTYFYIMCSIVLFLFGNTTCVYSQNSESFSHDQKMFIKSSLQELPENTQFSIAILKDNKTKYLGLKNEGRKLTAIDNKDAVFEIGSITKVMSSALLAKAVVNEEVRLDTKISELIGYPLLNDVKITLEQLSNHTSGVMRMPGNFLFAQMKDPNNPYIHYNEAMLKTWLTEYMTTDLKHNASNYSNLGAALLAHGLTKLHDKSYEELLQETIFKKLEMNSSTTKLELIKSQLIHGQDQSGEECPNWEFDVLEGAGAVFSSVSDLERFAKAVISQKNEALNLQTQPTFKVSDRMSIGLGWHIINSKAGHRYLWHNGGTNGYTSSFLIDVDRGISIIILTNLSAFHQKMGNIDHLLFQLINTYN